MDDIKGFRLGNFALFEGELQRIVTQTGLDNAAYLDPLPITEKVFSELGLKPKLANCSYSVYMFAISPNDSIKVMFSTRQPVLIIEQRSRVRYPDIKWMHELQNLVEDRKAGRGYPALVKQYKTT